MRRITAVALAVVVALSMGAILAMTGGAKPRTARTLHLITKDFDYHQVDNPPVEGTTQPPSAGDVLLFEATVTNTRGSVKGTKASTCTVTHGGAAFRAVCTDIYDLNDGDIHLQTRVVPPTVSSTVVGGTGAYAGYQGGTFKTVRTGTTPGSPVRDTITLKP
jgi:hypothetical protein